MLRPKILSDISVNLNDPIVSNTQFVSVLHHVQSFELSPAESVYSSNKDIFLRQPFLNIKKHEVEDVQRSIRTSIPSPAIASTVIKIQ